MPAANVFYYDIRNVSVIVSGHIVEGIADVDDAIEVEPAGELVTLTKGVYGEYALSNNPDDSAILRLRLMPESPSNDRLYTIAQTARTARIPIAGFLIKDASGTSKVAAPFGGCMTFPTLGFAKQASNKVWEFVMVPTAFNPGSITPA